MAKKEPLVRKRRKRTLHRIVSDTSGGCKVGSTRVRVFKALSRVEYPEGFSATQLKLKCGLGNNSGYLGTLLVEEVARGRFLKWVDYTGADAQATNLYCLTALGQRDFAAKSIDATNYAGKRIGKSVKG